MELGQLFQSSHQKCCLNTARQIAARRQKFRSIFAEQSAVQRVQAPVGDVCTVSEQGAIFSASSVYQLNIFFKKLLESSSKAFSCSYFALINLLFILYSAPPICPPGF